MTTLRLWKPSILSKAPCMQHIWAERERSGRKIGWAGAERWADVAENAGAGAERGVDERERSGERGLTNTLERLSGKSAAPAPLTCSAYGAILIAGPSSRDLRRGSSSRISVTGSSSRIFVTDLRQGSSSRDLRHGIFVADLRHGSSSRDLRHFRPFNWLQWTGLFCKTEIFSQFCRPIRAIFVAVSYPGADLGFQARWGAGF